MDESEMRNEAIRKIHARRGLAHQALIYLAVNVFLVVVWAATGGGSFWPIWVIGSWGIALAFSAIAVFGRRSLTEDDIQREMGRGS